MDTLDKRAQLQPRKHLDSAREAVRRHQAAVNRFFAEVAFPVQVQRKIICLLYTSNSKLDEIKKGNPDLNNMQLAMLTSINIADEYMKLFDQLELAKKELEKAKKDLEKYEKPSPSSGNQANRNNPYHLSLIHI